ncbi:MAG: response regulator [Chloroflexaceae bacterium]|nr:response regulator [Chloroflexaceae bacterium]
MTNMLFSLRTRLFALVLLAIVPSLVLVFITGIEQEHLFANQVQNEALRLTRLAAAEQQTQVQKARQLLVALAQLPSVRDHDVETCTHIMTDLRPQFPEYTGISAVYPNGDPFCTSLPNTGINVGDRDYFRQVLATRDFTVSDYLIGRKTGKAIIAFAYPSLDAGGQVQAVVIASLDLAWFEHLATSVDMPSGSTFTAFEMGDQQGTILGRYPNGDTWVGKEVGSMPIIQRILAQGDEGTTREVGLDGVSRLFAFTTVRNTSSGSKVFMMIGIPTEVAFAESRRILVRNLMTLALVMLLTFAAAWVGGDAFLVRPITRLMHTTHRLATGDLQTRTGVTNATGELEQLASSIDQMAEALQQRDEALWKSEARLNYLVSTGPVVIFSCRAGGDYGATFISPNVPDVFGHTANQLTGDSQFWASHIHPEDAPRIFGELALLFERGHHTHEYRFLHGDGEYRWVENHLRLIRDTRGKPVEIVGSLHDVTKRRQAEEALRQARNELEQRVVERTAELSRSQAALAHQKDILARQVDEQTRDLKIANAKLARAARLKDEFLANMSHELRTPLNAILGLSEVLQEEVFGPLNDKQRSSLHSIEESGRHLLALINDILDLSKIEAGKTELEPGPVSVESICQTSLQLIRSQAHKKGLRLSQTIDHGVIRIQADERRLKQILVNLLSNAVKFTPDGGKVGLEVIGQAEHQSVQFVVWDTGIGIGQEEMPHLFEPFVQLDSGLNRHHEGTGLGLALVARLTEMHGGSVAVESEVGKGSRFTVSLPWQAAKPDETPALPAPTSIAATRTNELPRDGSAGVRHLPAIRWALIVEDSPSAAEQIIRYLGELAIATTVYRNGRHILDQVVEMQPDLIILDILLPDASGWDILTALKADARTHHIPVLIISVVDEPSRGLKLGAAGYLVKPVTRQHFRAMLQRISPEMLQPGGDGSANVTGRDGNIPSRLPMASPEHQAEAAPPERLILLAEDNETSLIMMSEYLESKGYRVNVAYNGVEAIERVRRERPDLILMDIQMPGMDGLEATRHIRAIPDLADIPIIALTALAMTGDREQCLEAGANDYMSKPVSLKQLMQTIERYLEPTPVA